MADIKAQFEQELIDHLQTGPKSGTKRSFSVLCGLDKISSRSSLAQRLQMPLYRLRHRVPRVSEELVLQPGVVT